MYDMHFMSGWAGIVGLLMIIAVVAVAFGLILGILKPADAFRRAGAVCCFTVPLLFLPAILMHAWAALFLWQQIGIIAVGIGLLILIWPRRSSRRRRRANDARW